jgi:uncharacterized peroxidase-related enzyme
MPFVSFLPGKSTLGDLFVQDPDRYRTLMEFGKHIMTGPSELDRGDRELTAAYVSALNGCSFCLGTHSAIARAFGHDPDLLKSLISDPASAPLSAALLAVMDFVRKLCQEPSRMIQSDADAVISAGWNEQTLSDVIAITAYYNLTNRLVDGHGVGALSASDNEVIGQQIARHGYPDLEAIPKPSDTPQS